MMHSEQNGMGRGVEERRGGHERGGVRKEGVDDGAWSHMQGDMEERPNLYS